MQFLSPWVHLAPDWRVVGPDLKTNGGPKYRTGWFKLSAALFLATVSPIQGRGAASLWCNTRSVGGLVCPVER